MQGKFAADSKGAALIVPKPIHYHILPPNESHPCHKYGCTREAKYQLDNGFYLGGHVLMVVFWVFSWLFSPKI